MNKLLKVAFLAPSVALLLTSTAIAQTTIRQTNLPNPRPGCPDGWIPRLAELNPALGPCMPGAIKQPTPGVYSQILLPDLKVRQFQFLPRSKKMVRVQVVNYGKATAAPSILRLTVRRINGTPVGRVMEVKLPPIKKQQAKLVLVNAKSILPNSVALKDTTFRFNVDATKAVVESNESNNETWHNL